MVMIVCVVLKIIRGLHGLKMVVRPDRLESSNCAELNLLGKNARNC